MGCGFPGCEALSPMGAARRISPFSTGWCSVNPLLHEELQQGRRGLQRLEATMQDLKMELTS